MTTDDTTPKPPGETTREFPLEATDSGLEGGAKDSGREKPVSPEPPTPTQQTLPDTPKMRNRRKIWINLFLGLVLLAGAAVVARQFYREQFQRMFPGASVAGKSTQRESARQGDVYYCPMHKEYQSDKPGNCPICSMQLVKLEKSDVISPLPSQTAPSMKGTPAASSMPGEANTIFIAPQRRQIIGMQTAPATFRPLVKEIRAVGKISYDETKLTHIHTKVGGWIERVFVDFVGKFVSKGDPLFTLYSPDLVSTQEEYLVALRARKELATSSIDRVAVGAEKLVEASRRRLRLWDVTDEEIARLEKEGKASREITHYSPVSGIVTQRAAYHHGGYVTPEMELYTIVDLSTVWVLGEIYETDLPLVRLGQKTEVDLPYRESSPSLRGTVTYINPFLNPATRTGQIRMIFANPDNTLKPEMFVNVKLRIDLGRQLTVPEDAVLDTGTEQYVFVDKGGGYFEPRLVKPGVQTEGYYAIKAGLKAGEHVATAANFILDSESRLKGAFASLGLPGQEVTPVGKSSQELQIKLRTDPEPAKVGDNTVTVSVKDSKDSPIPDASVQVKVFMPAMGSMAPMSSEARLVSQGNGEYLGSLRIPMAWTWQTTVTVERSGQMLGSAQFTITAR